MIETPALTVENLVGLIASIGPVDELARAQAATRQDSLTKPPGSLGRLEELSLQLAAITSSERVATRPRSLILAAADHGVVAEGVSAYPPEVTAQMVVNFLTGGAAVNVLARAGDVNVVVLDVGVAATIPPSPALVSRKIRTRTGNIAIEPAMSQAEALAAIQSGLEVAFNQIDRGARVVAIGDMGIGNTTASSALTAALLGLGASDVTGRGAGLDDEGLIRKVSIVERCLARYDDRGMSPLATLAALGGFEIAALVGVILGCASRRVPVIADGFVSGAAALVAAKMAPQSLPYIVPGHCSAEPGHRIVLEALGMRPLLDLEMRLGEGTGALLALHLVDAAAATLNEMATFAEAGVSGRDAAG